MNGHPAPVQSERAPGTCAIVPNRGQAPFPRRPRNGARHHYRGQECVPRANRGGGGAGGGQEEGGAREDARRDDGLVARPPVDFEPVGFDRGYERPDAAAEAGAEGGRRHCAALTRQPSQGDGLGYLVGEQVLGASLRFVGNAPKRLHVTDGERPRPRRARPSRFPAGNARAAVRDRLTRTHPFARRG